jgi:anti-anti-sigma regulatory factor
MPLTVERNETRWLIRLAGEFNLSAASELKSLLLEALASTKELQLDLSAAEQIDITLLQLLDAA